MRSLLLALRTVVLATGLMTVALSNVAYAAPVASTSGGLQGCPRGFWKQLRHLDSWSFYSPGQTLESVFDVPDAYRVDNIPLLDALSFDGGPTIGDAARNLVRAGVAGLLNAQSADVNYPITTSQVIAEVDAAIASGDRTTILAEANRLEGMNNLRCPLS